MISQKELQRIMEHNTLSDRWYRFIGLDMPEALTMREWREWDKTKKSEMPVRFFLGKTLVHGIARWQGRIQRAWEAVLFRTVWRNRYRRIDLRRGDPSGEYQRGWLSAGVRFEFAMVVLIRNFVEHRLPEWEKNGWQDSANKVFARARALHAFWMIELPALETENEALLDAAFGEHEIGDELSPEQEQARANMQELETRIEEKKREATLEFFELRGHL